MQKYIVAVQDISPGEVVDELGPSWHEVHNALYLLGHFVPLPCQAVQQAAAAWGNGRAV